MYFNRAFTYVYVNCDILIVYCILHVMSVIQAYEGPAGHYTESAIAEAIIRIFSFIHKMF